jgi:hypothetical protein
VDKKSRLSVFLSLLLLSILVVASFFLLPAHATPAWTLQTISNSAFDGDIALDSNNFPHIAYAEYVPGNGTDYIIYASWNGAIWTNQTVTQNAALLDLVLDSHNNANILLERSGEYLMYARWTGYDWSIQTIDHGELWGGSLALDSADKPHIAYIINDGATDYVLKYNSWTGSSWSNETVDMGNMTYLHSSLRLDAQNRPRIMYETEKYFAPQNVSETLKYAAPDNASGWTIQTVGQNIESENMVLDSNGYPHFSCATQEGLAYVSWNGLTWKMQSANVNAVSGESYLALDKQNYPHISFINSLSYENLMYAKWTGNEWNIQTVDSNPMDEGSMAIDSNGNPYLCYFKVGTGGAMAPYTLTYATTAPKQTFTAPLIGFLIAIPVIAIFFLIALAYVRMKKTQKLSK